MTQSSSLAPSTRPTSIRDRLEADNRPAGFDYLRIVLALLILVDHSLIACGGMQWQTWAFSGPTRPIVASLVPMFFALSGFLVATSLARTRSMVTFVGLRALRILPALTVDTLFCALLLGPAITSLPLHEYFSASSFWHYFLNILGDIHYQLPGVFDGNIDNKVNVQLWTIPLELQSYAILTLLAVLGFHRRRWLFLLGTCVIIAGDAGYVFFHPMSVFDVKHLVIPSFLVGVAIYLYQDRIEWSLRYFLGALIAMVVLLYQHDTLMVAAVFPMAYVTVWLGLLRPERIWLIRSGDYSYPLYLYSFPIQQALIAISPLGRIWWVNVLAAIPVAFVFAAVSWHLIEKPAQNQRHYLYALEKRIAAWRLSLFGATT